MKRTVMAAMVLSLLTGTVALAAPQDHQHDRQDQRQSAQRHGHQDVHDHAMNGRAIRGQEMRANATRGNAMRGNAMRGNAMRGNAMRGNEHEMRGNEMRGHELRSGEMRGHEMRGHEMRGEMRGHADFDSGRYERPHGYYSHRWRRGERLPLFYREPVYVIPDYDYYRLPPPPPGYYWVRVDDNAVLAAIATGLVADIVYNVFD